MAHLIDTRSAATAHVVYRALQQLMRWLQDEEEIDRSPMEADRSPIVPENRTTGPQPLRGTSTTAGLRPRDSPGSGKSRVSTAPPAYSRVSVVNH